MSEGIASDWTPRHVFVPALAVLRVASAGCAILGLGGDGGAPSSAATGSSAPAHANAPAITVDGESVEPGEYYLTDGDAVAVVVEADG